MGTSKMKSLTKQKTPSSFIKGLKNGDKVVFMETSSDGSRYFVKKGNLMGEDPYYNGFLNVAHAPKGSKAKDKVCKLVRISWVRPDTLEGNRKIKELCLNSQARLVMKFERDIDKMRAKQERQVDAAYKKLEQLENYRETLYDKLHYAY